MGHTWSKGKTSLGGKADSVSSRTEQRTEQPTEQRTEQLIKHPIEHPIITPWHLPISTKDRSRLKKGFKPTSMDDKWVCYAGPEHDGVFYVHLCRSWTGREQFRLKVVAKDAASEISEIMRKGTFEEAEAKETALAIYKHIMGCELDLTSR